MRMSGVQGRDTAWSIRATLHLHVDWMDQERLLSFQLFQQGPSH